MHVKFTFLSIFIFSFVIQYELAFSQDRLITDILYNFTCGSKCQEKDRSTRAEADRIREESQNRGGWPEAPSRQQQRQLEAEKEAANQFAKNADPGGLGADNTKSLNDGDPKNKGYDFTKAEEEFKYDCGEGKVEDSCKLLPKPARVVQGAVDKFTKKPANVLLADGQKPVGNWTTTVDAKAFKPATKKQLLAKKVKTVRTKKGMVKKPISGWTVTVTPGKDVEATGVFTPVPQSKK